MLFKVVVFDMPTKNLFDASGKALPELIDQFSVLDKAPDLKEFLSRSESEVKRFVPDEISVWKSLSENKSFLAESQNHGLLVVLRHQKKDSLVAKELAKHLPESFQFGLYVPGSFFQGGTHIFFCHPTVRFYFRQQHVKSDLATFQFIPKKARSDDHVGQFFLHVEWGVTSFEQHFSDQVSHLAIVSSDRQLPHFHSTGTDVQFWTSTPNRFTDQLPDFVQRDETSTLTPQGQKVALSRVQFYTILTNIEANIKQDQFIERPNIKTTKQIENKNFTTVQEHLNDYLRGELSLKRFIDKATREERNAGEQLSEVEVNFYKIFLPYAIRVEREETEHRSRERLWESLHFLFFVSKDKHGVSVRAPALQR